MSMYSFYYYSLLCAVSCSLQKASYCCLCFSSYSKELQYALLTREMNPFFLLMFSSTPPLPTLAIFACLQETKLKPVVPYTFFFLLVFKSISLYFSNWRASCVYGCWALKETRSRVDLRNPRCLRKPGSTYPTDFNLADSVAWTPGQNVKPSVTNPGMCTFFFLFFLGRLRGLSQVYWDGACRSSFTKQATAYNVYVHKLRLHFNG